eukprot:gene10044-11069_t
MSSHCGKAFLYFYNLVYLGFSAVLIYLAVFFVKNWSSYTRIAIDTYAIVPAGIIVAVSIIFLVAAIIGIYGTGRSNRCCLGVFFAFLLAVFILEIVLGSLGYVYHQKIEANVKKDLTTALKKYPIQGEGIIRDAFNKMQSELKCCGVKGPNDWKNVTGKLPKSCCLHPSSECSYTFLTNVYQQLSLVRIFGIPYCNRWSVDLVQITFFVPLCVSYLNIRGSVKSLFGHSVWKDGREKNSTTDAARRRWPIQEDGALRQALQEEDHGFYLWIKKMTLYLFTQEFWRKRRMIMDYNTFWASSERR